MTLNGQFKSDTGEKWHMLPLVDTMESLIEVRKWVGRWLYVLVEQYGRLGVGFSRENEERG